MNDTYRQFVNIVDSSDYVQELNRRGCFLRFKGYIVPVRIREISRYQDTCSLKILLNYVAYSDAEDCKRLCELTDKSGINSGAVFEIDGCGFECQDACVANKGTEGYPILIQVAFSLCDLLSNGIKCIFGRFVIDQDDGPFERWELLEIPE